jgi:2-polyprenyl-3-methyl-5-hydroxy-6-metoxy-1,4-benzoquinol methylase
MADLTTPRHWDEAWAVPPRWRLPSSLVISTRNVQRVLRRHVRSGMHVLELGCAPGKILAWTAIKLGARVSGVDYSAQGIAWSTRLFERLGARADLRRENVLETSFPRDAFDVVYSWGLIEHFDDPRPFVRAHIELTRPGGLALIGVPNYGGMYGKLQGSLGPANLALHNLRIMSPEALAALAPPDLTDSVRAYPAGRFSPWLLNLEHRLPNPVARVANYALNGVGLLQPVDITPLCPLLVLEVRRR